MAQFDVSVIIPVYNTMPYLTETLESLVGQTLGLERIQVVAVDDGSTDGSGEELDRFAGAHPGSFVVAHQPNSGGPATPCNRGLELATGRYVFFLGADDYLGAEALQRLVEKADEWGSDVIFGRMEGVGGRVVYQGIFKQTRKDLDLLESDLAFSLSNTKLYRRELLERHQVHFARDLRVGSDQPFTIEAVLHAKRVSVLADYTYYYAVRRDDETNISYSSRWHHRVDDIGAVMHHVADLLPPGAERDAFLRRHFAWELTKLFREDFAHVDDSEQADLTKAVAALADSYLTDGVAARLSAESRLMLRLAQHDDLDTLRAVVAGRVDAEHRPLALDGDRVYSVLPGFRTLPDEWYDVTDQPTRNRVVHGWSTRRVRLSGATLHVEGETVFTPESARHLRIALQELPPGTPVPRVSRSERYGDPAGVDSPVTLEAAPTGPRSLLRAEVDLAAVLASDAAAGTRWAVRLRADVGPWTYDLPVTARGRRQVSEVRSGARTVRVEAGHGRRGFVFLTRERLPLTHVARRALRRAVNR